jgi:hypothetical protein
VLAFVLAGDKKGDKTYPKSADSKKVLNFRFFHTIFMRLAAFAYLFLLHLARPVAGRREAFVQLQLRSPANHGLTRSPASCWRRHAPVVPLLGVRMSVSADAMASSSRALMAAADHIVAAAAILGENQCEEEDPASLSSGGCSIANAARDAAAVSEALARREWEDATDPLAAMAGSLFASAACLEDICGAALGEAGIELEDASQVTGCIQLAAAAGQLIIGAGESLASAGLSPSRSVSLCLSVCLSLSISLSISPPPPPLRRVGGGGEFWHGVE